MIWTELISRYHDNSLVGHFGILKTCNVVLQKYYWPTLRQAVETYFKSCDMCLASKRVRHKHYSNLQSLEVPMHYRKDLFMDFLTRLPIFMNWKGDSFNSILVIVNLLTKIVYYKPIKVIINAAKLAKAIIDVVILHHSISYSIRSNCGLVFTSWFWSSLCYFLAIKQRLFIVFHP